jgi:hypothetical protein
VSAIDFRLAGVTVTVMVDEAEAQTLATVHFPVMIAVPVPTALILPLLLTVATDGSEEDQVISALTSRWLLSLYKAVALSCVDVPFAMLGDPESISIEFTPAILLFRLVELPPLQAAKSTANNARCENRTRSVVMLKDPIFIAIFIAVGMSEAVVDGRASVRTDGNRDGTIRGSASHDEQRAD